MDARTIERYRNEFPVVKNYIYLDHAGIAPTSTRVRSAIENFLQESAEGGAFFYHSWAQKVAGIRQQCARLIGAESREIAFVKNTSHGLSLVAGGLDWKRGDNVIYCEKDFPSNIYPWMKLAERGIEPRPVPHRKGVMAIADIESNMDEKTRLVAASSVQFSSGARTDLGKLGRLCSDRKVLLCVDAIQSLGVVPVDVREQRIDFLSADAHKWLLGPEGIGIFYCREGLATGIEPRLVGWKSVTNELDFDHPNLKLKADALRFEEGSQNIQGIIGLGAAVDLLMEVGVENVQDRVQHLGECIMRHAKKRGFTLLTPVEREERGGGVSFCGNFDPAAVRDRLRERGIMVNARGGGLRVSPHFYNTEREIDGFFGALDSLLG